MRTREAVAAGLRLSLSLPCFYAAANAAGVQFITVMYHLLRGEGWRESKGGREGGREGEKCGDENNAHAKMRT